MGLHLLLRQLSAGMLRHCSPTRALWLSTTFIGIYIELTIKIYLLGHGSRYGLLSGNDWFTL